MEKTEVLKSVLPLILLLSAGLLTAKAPFQPVVDYVDLEKFSGDWYVIALLPSIIEKDAVNGVETYTFDGDKVTVKYVFRQKSPDGKLKITGQRGKIVDTENNAVWWVQPLWPLRLPYLIIDLAEDYRYTAIGTNNYKYLWIMARDPYLSDEDLQDIFERLEARGYPVNEIKIMQQEW
ncbi:MAG: lipocalin family protein [Candidatus Neomarinimicrobiota bacterium]|jgi:apolipoprotein D and lipocalin family protein|nr:lipocalin family protein [Candidatus Neomarinimicrobiota bacterium]MDD3965662.1 lipocalin family protein [Candidatus Neomarinimicrobiota bacterium]MDX9780527.1 lipocalin family protein [bacterium]